MMGWDGVFALQSLLFKLRTILKVNITNESLLRPDPAYSCAPHICMPLNADVFKSANLWLCKCLILVCMKMLMHECKPPPKFCT